MSCKPSPPVHPVSFKVGDTLPRVGFRRCGTDLTGKTVTINYKRPDGTTGTITPTIQDAAFGVFYFEWLSTDLTIPGLYLLEVRIVEGTEIITDSTFGIRVEEAIA